jgi:hypothetical protein
MRTLAEKYGISDVGLAKNCRKLSIPLPGRGYWAKISAGQSVVKTPLPRISQEIKIEKPRPMPKDQNPDVEQITDAQERSQIERLDRLNGELVLKHGSLSHPLITQARTVLRQAREDDRKILQCREQCLDIRVSKGSLDRALRIMAGLISLIEDEGFSVTVGNGFREHTTAKVHGQEITFGLLEKVERLDVVPLPSENILKKVLSYGGKDVTLNPTGQLSFEIWRPWGASPKRWKDKKGIVLEGMLPQMVASFIRIALVEKQREEIRLAERREAQRREEERARLQASIKAEKAKIEALNRAVTNWVQADQIRGFIRAARETALEHGQEKQPGTVFEDWLIWAEQQADRIDPLKDNPVSIIDREVELQSPYRNVYGYREAESQPQFDLPNPIWKVK